MSTSKFWKNHLLLILGAFSFVIYLALFRQFGKSKPLLLALIKLATNACFIGFALMGVSKNRSLRNAKLIEALLFYAAGDISATFSVPVGGVFYLLGHLVLIRSLYITTLIQKKNVIWYMILAVSGTLLLLFIFRNDLSSVPIYVIYGLILNLKLALAIPNPIYLVASIVFTLSDILGVYRVINYGDSVFGLYIITIGIYYAGIVLYTFTAYRYEAKPVVTWSNMTVLARNMTRSGIRFCFTQGWGRDIAAGKYLAMHSDAYIAADIGDKTETERVLSRMGYTMTDSFGACNMYVYYSELFGFLNVSFRTFTESGVILGKKEYAVKCCRSIVLKTGIPAISKD